MKFIDLNELENFTSIETDLCIVGSGPAGATIAKEFAGSRVRVLLVEGGGFEETSADQGLFDVVNVGDIRIHDRVRNRVIGGCSHSWNGRCASFDDIDFETRAWVPHSGWPISNTDLHPFLERSRKHLGLGPNIYDDRLWKELGIPCPMIDPALLKSQFWQFSRDERNSWEPTRFSRAITEISATNVRLLMHANTTQLNTSKAGMRIKSLEVRSLCGRRAEITANVIVLACGGLENARLLLASNRLNPNGVGNSHGLVGRFLMDHAGCTLGTFDAGRSAPIQSRLGRYFLDHQHGRQIYACGLMLSPEIQKNEQLLNCAAFLEPTLGRNESWKALKRLVRSGAGRHSISKARDLSVVVRNLPSLLCRVYRRFVRQQQPDPSTDETSLYCLVEQVPDASNRVTLAQKTDALGMPLLRIDWRIGELERRSVIRLNELIELELRRIGLPEHSRNDHLFRDADWRSQFIDRAHPSGTTRMSDSRKQGVVNRNCMVHEVPGLYIAGSSIFPTVGHANPTLMIVALAIRLADWLKLHEFTAQYS
jgi:choline dehydrogenase-like flavoprotein